MSSNRAKAAPIKANQTMEFPQESEAIEWKKQLLPILCLFIISVGVYANTLWHDYALDDQMVIYENKFVTAGVDSIGKIMTSDAFEGFFGERGSKLISGGRYRPLTFVVFAIEWEFFGKNPFIGHLFNVLTYALLCILIYIFLVWLFHPKKKEENSTQNLFLSIAFLASIIYALHPIHTEVVANIKGRDELFGFLFGLMAIVYFFQFFKHRWQDFLLLFLIYLLALLSKENAITFLAIFPLVAFVKNKSIFNANFLKPYASVILAASAYLVLRAISTKASLTAHTEEILNNPFVRATASEKWGTIVFSFYQYIKLLIFPWTLSHDYYFNQIPYRKLSDPAVLAILFGLIVLTYWLIKNLKKRNEIIFSILFFLFTFSIVSNVLFTVGIIMNERFVFVSSLSFAILVAWLLLKLAKNKWALCSALFILLSFYSYKTYTRNLDWKDNDALFRADFYNSNNSAKVATAYGGSLMELSNSQLKIDSSLARFYIDSSIKVLEHSIKIYPENSQAWLLYGNAIYAKTRDARKAIPIYKHCLTLRQNYFDALYNIGILNFNMKEEDSAERYLRQALAVNADHREVRETLGKIYAKLGRTQEAMALTGGQSGSLAELAIEAINGSNYQEALAIAQKAIAQNPEDPKANFAIGICYSRYMNRLLDGIPFLEKAVRLNDKNGYWMEDLAVAYGMSGQVQKTIPLLEKVIALRPNDAAGYQNLATTYNLLGNTKKASYYLNLAKQKQSLRN